MKKVSTKLTSSTRHFQFEPLHALLRKGLWGLALACFTDAILKQKGTHRSPRNGMLLATKMRWWALLSSGILRQVHEAYTEIHARLKELKDKKVGFPMKQDETSWSSCHHEKVWENSKFWSILILSPVYIPFNLKCVTPMANKAERDRIAKEKKAGLALLDFWGNARYCFGAFRCSHDCVISR